MSVLVCVCAVPKGRSLSSSLHCPSFSALATQLSLCCVLPSAALALEPMHGSGRFRARWRQGRVDLLSTSAWQAQQQNLVVLLKLSRDPMIELNGFVFFLQEQTHLFLQKDQEINMSTEKPSSAGRSCNWLNRLSTYGQGTSGVSKKQGNFLRSLKHMRFVIHTNLSQFPCVILILIPKRADAVRVTDLRLMSLTREAPLEAMSKKASIN